jgi:FkbM family methyltransferase
MATPHRLVRLITRILLRVRERYFPRTEFATFPIVGWFIPLLLRQAKASTVTDIHGHRMLLDEKDSMGLSIDPMFEPLETRFCAALTRPGSVVIDIGANIGYYTLLFAKAVGPTGKVFAFEPDHDNFHLLNENIRVNGYENVVPVQAAVSDSNECIQLYRNDANRMDHRTYAPGISWIPVTVDATRLDDYVKLGGLSVDLIKMDIQGSEPAALKGMAKILNENENVVLITEVWPHAMRRAGHDPAEYLQRLAEMRFLFYRIDERRQRIFPTTADDLLRSLDDQDKWSVTNVICARGRVPGL